jgi:tRNA pseudouridine13 synthase
VTTPLKVKTAELAPRKLEGRGWSAEWVGWSAKAITAEAIERNRFTIVVRDMTRAESVEMDRRAAALRMGAEAGSGSDRLAVVNYFGDQRFGSARHGQGFAARCLMRGDFEGALKLLIATPARKDSGKRRGLTRAAVAGWGKWKELLEQVPRCPERRVIETLAAGGSFKDAFAALPNLTQVMAVEAYQSWLWNATARRVVEGAPGEKLRADDDFGEMVFAVAGAIPVEWRGMQVPMLASTTRMDGAWVAAAEDVLKEEAIAIGDLRAPGLRRPAFGDAPRPLIVEAEAFAISPAVPDGIGRDGRLKRTVRFELPRGAYATVVLRALGQ